jgi:hypothetical protein
MDKYVNAWSPASPANIERVSKPFFSNQGTRVARLPNPLVKGKSNQHISALSKNFGNII